MLINFILNLFLPLRCFACGAPKSVLCAKCAREREPAEPIDAPLTYARFAYRDPVVRKMIWALKYRGVTAVGERLGGLLYDYLTEELSEVSLLNGGDQDFLIIPIPLSPARRRRRGYNQATALAKGFQKRGGNNFVVREDLLYRTRDTGSQTEIKERSKRLKNMRDAFGVKNPDLIRGKQIIIIDDVTTTGATLTEARRVLEGGGAKIVLATAVAHG